MNFMGMGIPEIGVIVLVAFLVLGPGRSIDMARNAGKVLGDLRRSFSDVTSALSIDELTGTAKTIEKTDQHTTTQDQNQATPLEPPPGVPMRAEIPPEEEPGEEPGEEPAGAGPVLKNRADSGEKAESGETG